MSHLAYCILSNQINNYIGNRKGQASVKVKIESSDPRVVQVTERLMQISCRRMLTSLTSPLCLGIETETLFNQHGWNEQDVSFVYLFLHVVSSHIVIDH